MNDVFSAPVGGVPGSKLSLGDKYIVSVGIVDDVTGLSEASFFKKVPCG